MAAQAGTTQYRTQSGIREPVAEKPRMAYTVGRSSDGKASIEPRAFIVGQVTFGPTDEPHSWPPLCQWTWVWNDPAGHFVLNATTPMPCILRGTTYLQAALMPRTEIAPRVQVSIEGAEEKIGIPARVIIDDRSQTDWIGNPIILATIPAGELAEGVQIIRFTGGIRDYEIDGNPATGEFEPGGDANIAFIVQNHPAHLLELAMLDDSTTVYASAWRTEGPPRSRTLVLHRERAGPVKAGTAPAVTLRFSVPMARCEVTFWRDDSTWFMVPAAPSEEDDSYSMRWVARPSPRDLKPGRWKLKVEARDMEGNSLEPLAGISVPIARLGRLDPATGRCTANGAPCQPGTDEGNAINVTR